MKTQLTHVTYHFGSAPKPRPKLGDEKVIRGVLCVREFERSSEGHLVVRSGRQGYVWRPK